MAERYKVEVHGGCLGEWLPDGTVLVADPDMEIRPLDLCNIIIRDGDGPWARFMRSCGEDFSGATKIFLGWIDGVGAMVGQIVPPVVCILPDSEIESLHRIGGALVGSLEMKEADQAALALVVPFRRERR